MLQQATTKKENQKKIMLPDFKMNFINKINVKKRNKLHTNNSASGKLKQKPNKILATQSVN